MVPERPASVVVGLGRRLWAADFFWIVILIFPLWGISMAWGNYQMQKLIEQAQRDNARSMERVLFAMDRAEANVTVAKRAIDRELKYGWLRP